MATPFAEAMEKHEPFTVEARFLRADGEYRIVQTNAQPRFGPSGEFLGMIGVNVDITETRKVEQALRESEERFRVIAELHRSDDLGDAAGRLSRLLQPALVRIYRRAGWLDGRRGLERHVPSG